MTMTLEQVRDKLRRYAKDADNYFNRTRETLELTSAELLADAIDAHLLSQEAEIADLIGKRDFLLRHYNLAESRLAAADALLRDIKDWDVNQAQGTYLMVPLNLRKRIQAHLSENIHDHS